MTRTEPGTAATADAEQTNLYLAGPFAPVDQEITVHDLSVTGTIPPELDGRLLRTGPNPVDPEDPKTYNWFTGNGMVHGVRLRGGRAEWYRNRFVRDDQVVASRGLDPVPGPKQLGGQPRYVDANVVNTHIFAQAGKTWAFAEAGVLPIQISYELETVARSDFGGTLNGSWTGHPHRDPDTGELHGMSYHHGWDHVSYQVMGVDGTITKRIDVPVRDRPVVHDMAISERYAIFLDGPVNYSPELAGLGYTFPYRWDFGYEQRWALVPRDGNGPEDVRWCEMPGGAVFHILNAYDLPDGRVVLDGVCCSGIFIEDHTGPAEGTSLLTRYTLDPATGRTMVEILNDTLLEMPRLDERLTGKQHRYGYFSARGEKPGVLKHDLREDKVQTYAFGDGKAGMEAVFVPRADGAGEDDGWLMTYVTDFANNSAEVVILHSQDLDSGPVARIHIPQRVPMGFHGNWIPDEDLGLTMSQAADR